MDGKFEGTPPKSKRKRLEWNEDSEEALLDLWPERVEQLRTVHKNGRIYTEMAYELCTQGYSYSPRDVQVKLQNFTQRYRKEKAAMSLSCAYISTWPLYSRVDQIIGSSKPANLCPEVKLESIDDSSIASEPASSTPLASPRIPLPSPSPPLPRVSPSHLPSKSTSRLEPERKKGAHNFQVTILEKFEYLSSNIARHFRKSEAIEKELIEIEKKKVLTLERIVKDNEELKNTLISFLNET